MPFTQDASPNQMKTIKSKNLLLFILYYVLFFSLSAFGLDQSLNLDVIDQNFNSSDRIVIDEATIKRSRASSLAQILSSQANITITSSNFQPNSVFVRGGDSSHVLFIVDDVPTYDASTLQKTVNLGSMNTANIKRIEIIKGSQSVIYGGQALSAVIKIYTLPIDDKESGKLILQGSDRMFEVSAAADKKITDGLLIALSHKLNDSNNKSPAFESSKSYPQKTRTTDVSLRHKGFFDIVFKLNYSDDRNQIVTTLSPSLNAVDTESFKFDTSMYGGTVVVKKESFFTFSLSHQKNQRLLFQDVKNIAGGTQNTDQDYKGELNSMRFDAQIPLENKSIKLFAGIAATGERYESRESPTSSVGGAKNRFDGIYIKPTFLISEEAISEIGYRKEFSNGDSVGDVYQLGLTYLKSLKFEFSTGFKAPSLAQQYSPVYGNPNLKPEKATTANISYENKFSDSYSAGVSIFESNYENLFAFVNTKYENVSKTKVQGIEVASNSFFQNQGLSLSVFLAYQEPKDLTANTWLSKRPLRSAGLKITQLVGDDLSATVEINHVGTRRDLAIRSNTGSTYTTVDQYTLGNVAANWKMNSNAEIFTRIENILATQYQTSYGYYENEAKVRIGLQLE